MQTLIDDLLAFSRVGREGSPAAAGRVSPRSLADVRDSLAGPIEETGARIEAGELPTVHGDESLLRSLFQNLLANSLRFRGEDPPRRAHLFPAAGRGLGDRR